MDVKVAVELKKEIPPDPLLVLYGHSNEWTDERVTRAYWPFHSMRYERFTHVVIFSTRDGACIMLSSRVAFRCVIFDTLSLYFLFLLLFFSFSLPRFLLARETKRTRTKTSRCRKRYDFLIHRHIQISIISSLKYLSNTFFTINSNSKVPNGFRSWN